MHVSNTKYWPKGWVGHDVDGGDRLAHPNLLTGSYWRTYFHWTHYPLGGWLASMGGRKSRESMSRGNCYGTFTHNTQFRGYALATSTKFWHPKRNKGDYQNPWISCRTFGPPYFTVGWWIWDSKVIFLHGTMEDMGRSLYRKGLTKRVPLMDGEKLT